MDAPFVEGGSEILYRLAGPVLGGATLPVRNSPPAETKPLNGHSNGASVDSEEDSEDFVALGASPPPPTAARAMEDSADSGGALDLEKESMPLSVPPWMEPINARGSPHSTLLQLHQGLVRFRAALSGRLASSASALIGSWAQGAEIVSFCDFIAPSEEEGVVRRAAVQRVSDVVTSIWPQCTVSATHSFRQTPFLQVSSNPLPPPISAAGESVWFVRNGPLPPGQ